MIVPAFHRRVEFEAFDYRGVDEQQVGRRYVLAQEFDGAGEVLLWAVLMFAKLLPNSLGADCDGYEPDCGVSYRQAA